MDGDLRPGTTRCCMTDPRPTTDPEEIHLPVLLDRCVELLAPALNAPDAVFVDATVGLGGHSAAILRRFPGIRLIGLDRDHEALDKAHARLSVLSDRVTLVHAVYDTLDEVLDRYSVTNVNGILFDLGVSSLQLDETSRGFSYAHDAPLDMRMDATTTLTAEQVLADYSEADLTRLFREYGEEKLAARYARHIVAARASEPIARSGQLVDLLQRATPAALARAGHPAKRVFQSLRIEVNQELTVLARALPRAIDALAIGGRIVIESYHSLEDRIVKRELSARSHSLAPPGLPVELPEHRPELELLTRGAELADESERDANPRARSVRLRAAERIRFPEMRTPR